MVRKLLIIILLFSFLAPCVLEASPSVDVPLRHWSYDAIEKLAILGLCDIADIGGHRHETAVGKIRELEYIED